MTKTQKKIEELERKGEFDKHINPVDMSMAIPTSEFSYPGERSFLLRVKYFFERIFIAEPFTTYLHLFPMKSRVVGKENLRGIKKAILTCNHIEIFDCLAVRYAVRNNRLYTVGAPFNNMRGFLGEMMRAGDMIPLGDNLKDTARFNKGIKKILTGKKGYLLVYPEGSMWFDYEKPRPYKEGAFDIAAKYKLPLIPLFITLRDSGKKNEDGSEHKYFTVNIAGPIEYDDNLTKRENAEMMRSAAFSAARDIYEKYYNKKLEYSTEEEEK